MKRIAKVLGITSIISALHLVEDVVLFIIGRYTDVTTSRQTIAVAQPRAARIRGLPPLVVTTQ